MVDCRTMLSALVAAYDQHRRWMMADKFAALQRAVDHARDVLAAEPQIEAPGWCKTDAEQYAWQAGWEARDDAMLQPSLPVADGEVVELPPRPPLMEPPAHLALERYGITWDGSLDKPLLTRRADGYWTPWHVAANLLERQAAAAPVARLPEDAQVIEPANRAILVPVPTPIPVSERPPEPKDCDAEGQCWWGDAGGGQFVPSWRLCKQPDDTHFNHWLPAHALPLPEVDQ